MNGNSSMTAKAERLSNPAALEARWKSIDWNKAEAEVNGLQVRIAKATQEKKWNTVKRLQYLLTHSYHAKLLAVRKVTTNKGKKMRPFLRGVIRHGAAGQCGGPHTSRKQYAGRHKKAADG